MISSAGLLFVCASYHLFLRTNKHVSVAMNASEYIIIC